MTHVNRGMRNDPLRGNGVALGVADGGGGDALNDGIDVCDTVMDGVGCAVGVGDVVGGAETDDVGDGPEDDESDCVDDMDGMYAGVDDADGGLVEDGDAVGVPVVDGESRQPPGGGVVGTHLLFGCPLMHVEYDR